MKRIWLLAALVLSGLVVRAQEEVLSLDDVMDSAGQWAQENLDENALRVLQGADQEKVKKLFADFQKEFQGEYIVDLAALRDVAKEVLPLLENSPETRPYAAWLKTRMDYLDVAEQFRLSIPPPKSQPGQPPKPVPNPPAQAERAIWIKKVSERPWPKNAKAYVKTLKPVFSAQKVPPELVWIAEVESSFDPQACSPVGAAGLFQLMPATAKRFGLRTWPMDQRLKPEPSGRAAAQYLQYLYSRFKDWRL
ncbi:MAG TPA: transglycosylase SLT domain-containing protein, partial [Bacillota bacterium]|nr:transglycosylase SLT domain-containing protein [Bacillota bacterium]